MIRFLVKLNMWYEHEKRKNPFGLPLFIMLMFVVPMTVGMSYHTMIPWWLLTFSVLFGMTGFFIRFMWVVIGTDMIKYVQERYPDDRTITQRR